MTFQDSRTNKSEKTRLLCPKCNQRLIDEQANIVSELHIMEGKDPWPADYFLKCPRCKSEIGIRKIG